MNFGIFEIGSFKELIKNGVLKQMNEILVIKSEYENFRDLIRKSEVLKN